MSRIQLAHRPASQLHRNHYPNQTRECPGLNPASSRHGNGIRQKLEFLPSIGRYSEVPSVMVRIETIVPSFLHRYQTALGEICLETCFEAPPSIVFPPIHTVGNLSSERRSHRGTVCFLTVMATYQYRTYRTPYIIQFT